MRYLARIFFCSREFVATVMGYQLWTRIVCWGDNFASLQQFITLNYQKRVVLLAFLHNEWTRHVSFAPQLMHLISHVSSHLKVETKVKSAGTWAQKQPKAWCDPNAWECVTESTQRLHREFAGLIGDARQKCFVKDQPVESILSYCTHTLISHGHKKHPGVPITWTLFNSSKHLRF